MISRPPWPWHRSFGDLALVCGERGQHFLLLPLGHLDSVESAPEFSRDFIELLGRDPELPVGFFQAEHRAPGPCRREFERSARHVADPQGAHELQTRQSAEIVGVPFSEGRVCRPLTNDRVLDDRIAEVVDDRRDGEYATEPFVES